MKNTMKILVADDESVGRQLLEAILLPEGYSLVFSSDGLEAMDAIMNEHPDIVLLDVMMPKMDGFEVCRKIRANNTTAHMPVYLITALDDRDSRLRGIEAGADDYISKPFDRAEIIGKLKNRTNIIKHHKKISVTASQADLLSDSSAILLEKLITSLLPEYSNDPDLHISRTCSPGVSQHAFVRHAAEDRINYLFISNRLKERDAVLANCIIAEIWKNANDQLQEKRVNPFQKCILEFNNMIIEENLPPLKTAGFSIINISCTRKTGEVCISGLNQNIILCLPEDSPSQGLSGGFHLFSLQGGQELKFKQPARLLLLSPDLYEASGPDSLIRYMNDQIKNCSDAEIIEQLRKKSYSQKDMLIALLAL